MTSPPGFATPCQQLRSALPHGLRAAVQLKLNVKPAAQPASKNNHGQRHRDHLPERNENSNPRCGPCNAAELMNCPALPSGPTSQTHPTALLLREGGQPLQVWSSERATPARKHTATTRRRFSPKRHQPSPRQLSVYPPVCDFESSFLP